MKLHIYKDNDEILTDIIKDDGSSEKFTNLEMIDYLYSNKGTSIDLDFSSEVLEEEKAKINSLFKQIYEIINVKEDTKTTE